MSSDTTLLVQNLVISLGERRIVKGASFEVARKETLALVGESGSGKTMTAMAVMGLLGKGLKTTSGTVVFNGTDLLCLSAEKRRQLTGNRLAMIFQEPMSTLNPVMPVGYQVREALKSHFPLTNAEADERVAHIFERVQIPSARRRMNDYPQSFSGGMRQRIIIAAAIICKPDLLIADEPTTALDVTVQAQVLTLLRDLQDEYGMSMLFITHDMGVVSTIADRVIVMRQGEMLETGTVEHVFNQPDHSYTKALIASSTAFETGRSSEGSDTRHTSPLGTQQGGATKEKETEKEKEKLPDAAQIIEVKGLTTRFDVHGGLFNKRVGRVHAVEDVSFSLYRGRTLALVGESGSGKSTTGRALVGLSRPASGTIRYKGQRIQLFNDQEVRTLRTGAQMVFQDPYGSLNPRMKIGDSMIEPLLCRKLCTSKKEALDAVAFYLEQVGLDPVMADRYPHEFSGGQRQRISIAKAVSLKPDIIVADEAVSALDVTTKVKVIELFKKIQDTYGIGILFISHDIAAVNKISHRIAVMYMGRIVEIGPKEAILNDARHPYTQRLLQATLSTDVKKRALKVEEKPIELVSPVHPLDYEAPEFDMRKVGNDHFVLDNH